MQQWYLSYLYLLITNRPSSTDIKIFSLLLIISCSLFVLAYVPQLSINFWSYWLTNFNQYAVFKRIIFEISGFVFNWNLNRRIFKNFNPTWTGLFLILAEPGRGKNCPPPYFQIGLTFFHENWQKGIPCFMWWRHFQLPNMGKNLQKLVKWGLSLLWQKGHRN